jgi:glycerol-3-phosphate dehydrogenase subunit B
MRDVVVIGMGMSGLVAALRCQEAGLSVTLLAKGIGSTHLAPGTVDVLGYDPDLVESPSDALPRFVDQNPDHPYARIGTDVVRRSLEWFSERFDGYRYAGSMDENLLLPTAIGSLKPSALVPESLAAGDLRNGGRLLFVGVRQLKDFYPSLAAQNVASAKTPSGSDISARAVQIDLPTGGEADVSGLALARRFDDPAFLDAVATQISAQRDGEESIGLPAVLGVERPPEVWERLQDALGCPVFEIPGLPPSVPGVRLHEILRTQFETAGGRIIVGAEAVGADTDGDRITAVRVAAAARVKSLAARHFVLASGGFGSGAIEMTSSWRVRENIFDLPVWGVPDEGKRFSRRYFDRQPMGRAGIRVDDSLHPLDEGDRRLFANLTVVGACIAGSEPWREKSGEGISLSSGFKAASTVIEDAT